MMNIKVGMLPGRIQEFALEDGITVSQALEIAELNSEGYEIRVDSNVVNNDYVLSSSDKVVLLVKKIKGNSDSSVTIKVGMLPGKIEEYVLENGVSVANALEMAGLNPDGYEIRVDSNVKALDYVLSSSDKVVLLVKKIKGN